MTTIPDTLAGLAEPVDSLVPYPGNPRRGNVEAIADSLRTSGQYRPIVVNRRDRRVLAGNHTLAAAKALGWTEIAVTWVDVDDDEARRIVLADNRLNDLAGYDNRELADLLRALPDLGGTGYTSTEVDDLLALLHPPSLDDLAAEHGEPDEMAGWPVLRFVVPYEVRDRVLGVLQMIGGGKDEPEHVTVARMTELAAVAWESP
jgi:hypothetical protein